MKTIREIDAWLEGQDWYGKFCDNRDTKYQSFYEFDLREEERRAKIITNAFDWHHTPEGFEFWEKINREYIKWFTDGDCIKESMLMH